MKTRFVIATPFFLIMAFLIAAGVGAGAQKADPKPKAADKAVPDEEAPPAPAADQTLNFSETMLAVISTIPTVTDTQSTAVENFFAQGDNHPRVRLMRRTVYNKAVRAGVIPAGADITTINWTGLIAFLQTLIPMIQQLLVLFGL